MLLVMCILLSSEERMESAGPGLPGCPGWGCVMACHGICPAMGAGPED